MNTFFYRSFISILILTLSGMSNGVVGNDSADKTQNRITKILILTDYEYGYGGAVYPTPNPYLFFDNGTVVKNPVLPPHLLNLGARAIQEGKWGRYIVAGEKVEITWDQKTKKGKIQTTTHDWNGSPALPASVDETLDGTFLSIGGGGNISLGGSSGVYKSDLISLTRDGRFAYSSSKGGSGSGITAFNNSDTAGTYELDGFNIRLKFNNGKITDQFFCFYSPEKRVMRVGTSSFSKR